MKAAFVELPAFERQRERYLDDDHFQDLQQALMSDPEAGDMIPGAGGLRKLRLSDPEMADPSFGFSLCTIRTRWTI